MWTKKLQGEQQTDEQTNRLLHTCINALSTKLEGEQLKIICAKLFRVKISFKKTLRKMEKYVARLSSLRITHPIFWATIISLSTKPSSTSKADFLLSTNMQFTSAQFAQTQKKVQANTSKKFYPFRYCR